MKKEFVVNIILLILVNVLVKPLYLFGIDRKVQVLVGTEDFGQYIALFNFTLILQFINDFGLQAWTNRAIGQQTARVKENYGELISIRLQLSVYYLIVSLGFGLLWFGGNLNLELFLRLCINQILISGILFLRGQISGLGYYRTDSLISILDRLILILSCGWFIYSDVLIKKVSISWFVNMQSISLVLVLGVCVGFLMLKKFHFRPAKISFNKSLSYLKMGLPFALIYLTYAAWTRMDNIWLVKLLEDGAFRSGQYASAMRLYEAASMISLAFGTLLLSMFSRGNSDPIKNEELLKTSISVLLVMAMVLSLVVGVFSADINRTLYPGSDTEWDLVLEILMWAFIPASINFIFGAYFQATHREHQLWKLYALGFLLSAVLSLVFIPLYHVLASAFVFLIGQTVLMFVQFYKLEIGSEKNISFFYSILVFMLICVFGFIVSKILAVTLVLQLSMILAGFIMALYFSKLILLADLIKLGKLLGSKR
ncbi:MAG: polysaccharide biosynthesis C-terminal domain-containing protein [Saprospiraceae bacterium]|nr:polysaccharide biosynthesis C-terminal domain-containing protein [Saprospiraceae bacterium]